MIGAGQGDIMDKPFDAAISAFATNGAPKEVRDALADARKTDIPNDTYPYDKEWKSSDYDDVMEGLQEELVKMQAWVKETGQRIVVVFEGRDAAGKGGTIKAMTENLNPRGARVVALAKPTETEAGEWYFQRYVAHLPTKGEIVLFDRSWYNRGVVEHVFGFCTPAEREKWFGQVCPFERLLVDDGITLVKVWLNVGRVTQLQRFLAREDDPLKTWKLSWIDVEGLKKWDEYSAAIEETLDRTDTGLAPWTVVRSDDKKRARVAVIQALLGQLYYPGKGKVGVPDPKITGGPALWRDG